MSSSPVGQSREPAGGALRPAESLADPVRLTETITQTIYVQHQSGALLLAFVVFQGLLMAFGFGLLVLTDRTTEEVLTAAGGITAIGTVVFFARNGIVAFGRRLFPDAGTDPTRR